MKNKKTLLLIASCICFMLNSFVHAQNSPKKYPSLLWEISGNGNAKPSYVYGTMHVSNKLAFHLGDSFFLALNACDYVALESDPSTWLTEMFDSAYLEENGGLYRYTARFQNFYEEAFAAKELDKRLLGSSLNISGRMMNGMLYRNSDYNADFEEDTYLDMYIYQAGKKFNKTVIGLEDFQESDKLVSKSRIPDEDDQPKNKDYRKMMRSGKSPSEMMQDAYRNEDLDMVDSIQRIMNPSKNHQKYMLHVRNEIMAHNMDSIIREGKSLFSGIGAAHLAGEEGVIEMLRAMGYTVRPVTRVIADISKDYRDKLEKTYVKKPLKQYSTPDGWISVNLPGEFFELPANGVYKMYFYPEMSNGTNYSLIRIQHQALLFNQKPSYIIKRIDSLLYENIPGKIMNQISITQDGYPGFDIINKTKKGDFERYKIVVTPVEIIIFKVGGTLTYLEDNGNLDEVFNSFHVMPNKTNWSSFNSKHGFKIHLPGRIVTEELSPTLDNLSSNVVNIIGYDSDTNFYSVKRVSLHDFSYIEEDSFELSYIATEFNKSIHLTEVSRQWDTINGFPAMRVLAKDSSGFLHGLYAIDGPRYYQLLARTKDSIWPSKYFTSFSTSAISTSNSWNEFEDTSAFYSVACGTKPAGWSNFNYYEIMRKKRNKELTGYEGRYLSRVYSNILTDEEIQIDFHQFHKYYYVPSYDSLWRSKRTDFKDLSLYISDVNISTDSTIQDLVLTDTNSNRKIMVRNVVNNGTMYSFYSLASTNQTAQSPFVSAFWSSFKPSKDTIVGLPFNQNKANIFLEDLYSEDSLTQIHAINSFYQISFESSHVPKLIEIIESFKHDEFTISNRVSLIEKLGYLKHKNILPYLTEVYNRSIDTPQLQMAVLQALVFQKTPQSTKLFRNLLDSETPLMSEYTVQQLFWGMYDSLVLYKDLFPYLIDYTRYPEYKSGVYSLMANMLDSGVLKPKRYKKYKNMLVREAKDGLKRIMAQNYESDAHEYDYMYEDEMGYSGYSAYGLSDFQCYNKLLMPFKKDKIVKSYFERTRSLNNPGELYATSILFLREGINVNDTIWTHFANRDDYRIQLYSDLKKLNRLDLMPDSTKNQMMMARAMANNGSQQKESDSTHFVKKIKAENKKGEGYIYVFKKKDSYDDKEWNFSFVGIMPLDSTEIITDYDIRNVNNDFIDEEEMDKKLDKAVKDLFYADRNRVVIGKSDYYDGYGGY